MMTRYMCSIYKDRHTGCVGYPWNISNQIFPDCQFYDKNEDKLITLEDVQKVKSDEDISEYCVKCGHCCFFGPAACSKLKIIVNNEPLE